MGQSARFGVNSPFYKSLIGCFRCALFHTLIEYSVLLNDVATENQKRLRPGSETDRKPPLLGPLPRQTNTTTPSIPLRRNLKFERESEESVSSEVPPAGRQNKK